MAQDETRTGIDGCFFRLIATFEAAGMQQLGKIAHPVTGDVEVSLEGARDSIEILEMIRRKTEGNLSDDERRFLDHVLYQIRMNYVEVAKEREAEGAAAGAAPGDQGEPEDCSEERGAQPGDASATEPPGDEKGDSR